MATTQDCSLGFKKETTFKTGVTVDRWLEFLGDWSFNWNKNIIQGQGLRVGSRVARSARRVIPTADGSGTFTVEATSKGMGTLWEFVMGSGTSTLVSGTTFQQVFTLADLMPSATIQQGLVQAGGTVDAHTFLGCTCSDFEFDFNNAGLALLKTNVDIADNTTATGYASPSYSASPNLFHFANISLFTGTLTAPTATAVASAITPVADVRGGTLQVSHNLRDDRQNAGGGGRKARQIPGLRAVTGSLQVEYDSTTFRDMVLNDTPMNLLIQYTAGALSTGNETLQVIVPEIKLDGDLPKPNGTDLIVQDLKFQGLDNQTAAQPIWVVTRTADNAL
jgi:hypothetical protein